MVSGLVTSPFDQSRICSGLASEMRMALKLLTSSMSLLRAARGAAPGAREPAGTGSGVGGRSGPPGSVLEPGQVDAAQVGQRIRRGVLGKVDLLLVLVEDLHVEPQRLELLDEDLERLRHAGRLDVLTLDDGFVCLDAAHDVVRLD